MYGRAAPQGTLQNGDFKNLETRYGVEFWNLHKIYSESAPVASYGESNKARTRDIESIIHLAHLLDSFDPENTIVTFVNPAVQYKKSVEQVLQTISRLGFRYALFDVANSFGPRTDFWWYRSLFNRMKRRSMFGFRNRRAWFWKNVPAPVFAIVASRIREDRLRIQGLKTRYIRAHSRDYEKYYQIKKLNVTQNENGRFGVFLDQGMACSEMADRRLLDEKPRMTIDDYYGQVGKYIEKVICQAGLDRFVIALHPGNLDPIERIKTAVMVESCEVVRGCTAELVSESCLVAGSTSSAFALAVLFNKPVSFFVAGQRGSDDMEHERIAIQYASMLGRRVNYIDTDAIDYGRNEGAYHRFRIRYVKEPDTQNRSYYSILDQEIRNVFGI